MVGHPLNSCNVMLFKPASCDELLRFLEGPALQEEIGRARARLLVLLPLRLAPLLQATNCSRPSARREALVRHPQGDDHA